MGCLYVQSGALSDNNFSYDFWFLFGRFHWLASQVKQTRWAKSSFSLFLPAFFLNQTLVVHTVTRTPKKILVLLSTCFPTIVAVSETRSRIRFSGLLFTLTPTSVLSATFGRWLNVMLLTRMLMLRAIIKSVLKFFLFFSFFPFQTESVSTSQSSEKDTSMLKVTY